MKYLVTGGAGFIGSNLVEALYNKGEEVTVLDDLSSGKMKNIEQYMGDKRFTFIEGSITDPETCAKACSGADYVLHHAALCSVPASIEHPILTHEINVTGTINVFSAARDAGVKRVVWASSTSVYGNAAFLPNVETVTPSPMSPYAASKAANEMYASAFSYAYDMSIIGLRYYNVFGRRQDPSSQYAAVIPIFVSKLLKGEQVIIYGDGGQTRDFVHIDNVIQANLKAATIARPEANGHAFNIGCGTHISINELYNNIATALGSDIEPVYEAERRGDVRFSVADINAAREAFDYNPTVNLTDGLKESLEWYSKNTL